MAKYHKRLGIITLSIKEKILTFLLFERGQNKHLSSSICMLHILACNFMGPYNNLVFLHFGVCVAYVVCTCVCGVCVLLFPL